MENLLRIYKCMFYLNLEKKKRKSTKSKYCLFTDIQ